MDNGFKITAKLGEGTYGVVYKAVDQKNKQTVAIKKVKLEKGPEFLASFFKELELLQRLKHDNVVNLITAQKVEEASNVSYYLVLEYCCYDLKTLIRNPQVKFHAPEKRSLMLQLFCGLKFIHRNNVLHRDLKPGNILLAENGELKIADFGLARGFSDGNKVHTSNVGTLSYKCPELLLGATDYGTAIDMWAAGCIMAELWTRRTILKGATEQLQLIQIIKLCGSISPEVWPGVEELKIYNAISLPKGRPNRVNKTFESVIDETLALDLLGQLFTIDPSRRISAADAMRHSYFKTPTSKVC